VGGIFYQLSTLFCLCQGKKMADNLDLFMPSVSRWGVYYMGQAEGSKRKLQSLGLGDVEPGEYDGGDLHSNKTITVTSIGDDVVSVCDRGDTASKPSVTFVAPSEQIVDQAKSEVKRDSEDGAQTSHVTTTESPSVQSTTDALVDKQPDIKKSTRGVTKKKKPPVKKRIAHSASSLDIFSR
jgi:hypothetical protein